MTVEQNHFYMSEAIKEAKQALVVNEVPIGAIVVCNGRIIGRGHNMRERFQNVTFHAEMLAIEEACDNLHSWRLEDCELYVTLEPCMMCSGAIVNSRIKTVYYGAQDQKAGTVESLYHLLNDSRLNHQVEVVSGVMEAECGQMLKAFFKAIRQRKKEAKRLRLSD
ncbi:tRNA-specific adenosine deaminase [Paucilactobacillus oligofermentans DSM 15707 = LMG 22743]|uniref:tRNA-specific adenosine deaminase n=1 Tax=Paucilactobacillus oligofermentans DSM 15707 = LMG 22743 TaxID=1423778 RepID=A0A0R1RLN7_9LACO|nr:tRNA adenosine(34) deaminase TadA [Paucilactobacillus oligofermentans]KRL57799.1 tRNA-specific adenosine deaminase [Paucilactobacillus oligofermentans DSM 15707 = LMG 22743]CUS26744.1 tRNA-specific adenosine deaminase [Paucilactobacillus oligofermentans DSM 15707 = LMG 22743]